MLKIAIIIGSTRPGRNGEAVAKWVYEVAQKRSDAEFELVDIKDFDLPLVDEPMPPIMGQYSKPHTKVWAAKIDSFDGYVFVTPEYNHGTSGALKNAVDSFLPSGTTRRLASSATAGPVERVPSSSCVSTWRRCKWPPCVSRSCSPCTPTSKTSASSSQIHEKRRRSTRC
jgi:Predicted flavoprotein